MMFHLKLKLINKDMDIEQMKYIENNIRYFIRAIKNSLAINNYCVHLEHSEEIGYYYLIHYETSNEHNVLENRILEIQENEVLGKYLTDNKNWKNIMLEIVE